jgi:hypothetical protein
MPLESPVTRTVLRANKSRIDDVVSSGAGLGRAVIHAMRAHHVVIAALSMGCADAVTVGSVRRRDIVRG